MSAYDIAAIIALALGVFLPKALPLVLVGDRLPPSLSRWLQYVAPAVLAALVAPTILAPGGRLAIPGWEYVGYLVALVVALATRKMLPALGAGLAVFVVLALVR